MQEGEIVTLFLGLAALILLLNVYREIKWPWIRLIYLGFLAMACGYIFTVVEHLVWHDFFNFLEHLFYLVSGLTFAISCWLISQQSAKKQKTGSGQ